MVLAVSYKLYTLDKLFTFSLHYFTFISEMKSSNGYSPLGAEMLLIPSYFRLLY